MQQNKEMDVMAEKRMNRQNSEANGKKLMAKVGQEAIRNSSTNRMHTIDNNTHQPP